MNLRKYVLFRAWLFAALATGMFLAFFKSSDTSDDYVIFSLLILVFGFMSFLNFRRLPKIRAEDRLYAPPTDATVTQQIRFYKRMGFAAPIVFTVLSIITASDLNDLESGRVESVSLWVPIKLLYDVCGYWPTIVSIVVVGLLVCFGFYRKIKSLRES